MRISVKIIKFIRNLILSLYVIFISILRKIREFLFSFRL